MVVRYDYLWQDEGRRGRREGVKVRPCAVVVARRMESESEVTVLLAAITHSEPRDTGTAIEIPILIKRLLGLDEARSWIVLSEVNAAHWSDPGIVPASVHSWSYGSLPPAFARKIIDVVLARFRIGQVHVMRRK